MVFEKLGITTLGVAGAPNNGMKCGLVGEGKKVI